jgi:hypothetical protein
VAHAGRGFWRFAWLVWKVMGNFSRGDRENHIVVDYLYTTHFGHSIVYVVCWSTFSVMADNFDHVTCLLTSLFVLCLHHFENRCMHVRSCSPIDFLYSTIQINLENRIMIYLKKIKKNWKGKLERSIVTILLECDHNITYLSGATHERCCYRAQHWWII